jgi:hypothetical protein
MAFGGGLKDDAVHLISNRRKQGLFLVILIPSCCQKRKMSLPEKWRDASRRGAPFRMTKCGRVGTAHRFLTA